MWSDCSTKTGCFTGQEGGKDQPGVSQGIFCVVIGLREVRKIEGEPRNVAGLPGAAVGYTVQL